MLKRNICTQKIGVKEETYKRQRRRESGQQADKRKERERKWGEGLWGNYTADRADGEDRLASVSVPDIHPRHMELHRAHQGAKLVVRFWPVIAPKLPKDRLRQAL